MIEERYSDEILECMAERLNIKNWNDLPPEVQEEILDNEYSKKGVNAYTEAVEDVAQSYAGEIILTD